MTLRIIQITDSHISLDSPQRLNDLENCVRVINEQTTVPELVIHTGDITHNGLAEEYHSAKKILDKLKAPYFVMAGNKDKRKELLQAFSDERYELPEQGWVQYAVDSYPVRLLMVDTVSLRSNKGQLCTERLSHLKSMLLADTEKPTALFLHHPPYEATGIPDPYQYESWDDVENLTRLLRDFKNICGMYCGHVHRFIDGEIAGIQASALSCLAGDLRKGDVNEEDRKLPIFKVLSLPENYASKT